MDKKTAKRHSKTRNRQNRKGNIQQDKEQEAEQKTQKRVVTNRPERHLAGEGFVYKMETMPTKCKQSISTH